jgi:DnaK suppressor protein
MKEEDLKKYEKLLIAKRDELLEQLKDRKKAIDTTIKDSTGDISSYSYHMADQGTDHMEREKAFLFAHKSGRLLYHIEEALRRIRKGEFGKCHSCGKEISKTRLNAVPHARFCLECKEKEESEKGRGR